MTPRTRPEVERPRPDFDGLESIDLADGIKDRVSLSSKYQAFLQQSLTERFGSATQSANNAVVT